MLYARMDGCTICKVPLDGYSRPSGGQPPVATQAFQSLVKCTSICACVDWYRVSRRVLASWVKIIRAKPVVYTSEVGRCRCVRACDMYIFALRVPAPSDSGPVNSVPHMRPVLIHA